MLTLGISAYYHDAAACLIEDCVVVGAVQEERFTRLKYEPALPVNSARYCLDLVGATIADVDALAFYEVPAQKTSRQQWLAERRMASSASSATAIDTELRLRGGVLDPNRSKQSILMQNYRRHIEEHLLPTFGDLTLDEVSGLHCSEWEKRERAVGYAESSIKTWRATLHLILADSVDAGLRDANPAARRRGRGKRSGAYRNRGPEKAVTTALGILLIAERAALLSGRDDEFVAVVLKGYTGMRWGEVVGLESEFVRSEGIRVEWQLYELDTGEMHRCPPKDGSHRTIDSPDWLTELVAGHLTRTQPQPYPCHDRKYVFRGRRAANGAAQRPGPKLINVARRAGVSTGTVSMTYNHPQAITEATRAKVERAAADLGYSEVAPPVRCPLTGTETASPRGYSARLPLAGTRPKRRSKPTQSRCWRSRGRAFRCAAETPLGGRMRAGCRSLHA